jgi:hypothetical protein
VRRAPIALAAAVIRRIVRQNMGRFRACYQRELTRDPELTARAVPKFTIAPDGSVVAVTISPSTGLSSLDACLTAAFRALAFPRFDGGNVVVSYPLIFEPKP